MVVDRAWANRFFPGQDVLGRRFRSGGCTTAPGRRLSASWAMCKWTGLDGPEDGTVYWPFVDLPERIPDSRDERRSRVSGVVDAAGGAELDPALALSELATGDELVSEALATPRYLSVLIAMLAIAALVLSVVGVYGVMAYFVQQHTRDIGIRLALGGDRRACAAWSWRTECGSWSLASPWGIGAALLVSRLIATLLFGVSPTDFRTLIGVPAVLLAVAICACLVPAHRAARVDPADILREG